MSLWILIVYLFQVISAKDCQFPSFYIENNAAVSGKPLDHLKGSSLNDCAANCTNNKQCNAANFVLSLHEQPICMLVDSTKNGSLSEQPASSMYALRSYCQDKKPACRHPWNYERFQNYELLDNHQFLLGTASNFTIDQCLNSCTRIHDCEAVFYSQTKKECRLSKASLNNVNGPRRYFKYSEIFDLYESNCPKRNIDKSFCGFTRISQAGFVDVFDARLDDVKDLVDCESKCLAWNKGFCRSYTYDKSSKLCYISHANQKALGRSVLESLGENLSSGEVDDCLKFKLECHGKSLKLKGTSTKLFKGSVSSRKNKKTMCIRNITESYRFETEFSFDSCGIDKQYASSPTFVGLLFVKEGSTNLITIHDKVLEVKCKIHDQLTPQQDIQSLSFHFKVEGDQNASVSLNSQETGGPRYTLEVLNSNHELTSIADMKKNGYLVIDSSDSNETDFIVTSLVAEDGFNSIELIDSNGCVTKTNLVTSMEKISQSRLQIGIIFDGFPDQASVTYQTLIKPCNDNCELECNREFYTHNSTNEPNSEHGSEHGNELNGEHKLEVNSTRQKRHSTQLQRYYTLSDHLYRAKRTVLSSEISDKEEEDLADLINLLQLSNEQNKNTATFNSTRSNGGGGNIWQCFTEEFGCLFITSLVVLQIFLLFFCTCLAYKYAKKLIKYYNTRGDERRRPSMFRNFCNYNRVMYGDNVSGNSTSMLQTTSSTAKH